MAVKTVLGPCVTIAITRKSHKLYPVGDQLELRQTSTWCSRTKYTFRNLDIDYLFPCSSARTNHCLTKLRLPHSCPVGVVPPSESKVPLIPIFYFFRTRSQLSLRLTDPTAALEWTESKLELVVKVLCFCIQTLTPGGLWGVYDLGIIAGTPTDHMTACASNPSWPKLQASVS